MAVSHSDLTQVNGHNLYIKTLGPSNGPGVVLLHHGLGSTRAWRAQIPALTVAGWQTVAYDRWGYGKSDPRENLSMPTFVEDIVDLVVLLDTLDIQQVVLVGHSDGGTIALYFAAQFPQRVVRLVTIAAHIYLEPKMEPGIQGIRQMYEGDARFRQALVRAHGDNAEAVFWGWYDGWRREENLDWDMRPRLKHITCPTLVVQGLEDEHAQPQHAREIVAGIPNAELWLAEGLRHMLPQEEPDAFNQRLLEFLRPCATEAGAKKE